MNLPNKITMFRLLLVPLLWICGSFLNFYSILAGAVLGFFIGLLDVVDGYIARKYKMTTKLGAILDPLADKILAATAFIFFVSIGMMPFALVAVILSREFLICFLRVAGAREELIIGADLFGKLKAFLQDITLLLFGLAFVYHLYLKDFHARPIVDEVFIKAKLLDPLLYLTLFMTVFSLLNYVYAHRKFFKDHR